MVEKLTPQQQQAVEDRGGKLLISAAAGSGKTKVLVDRLLSYITDPSAPANLDDFLIITYTKAAAAELRSKIATKLAERIASEPGNRHLQQQMQRIYLTKISTVHGFCTELLREFAYRLDISCDFRVAEENECYELMAHVLDRLLDSAYQKLGTKPDFRAFVDSQGLGRDDRQIPEIVLKVYNSARCHLNPDAWLEWCLSIYCSEEITDASQTLWGKYLIDDLHQYLDLHILSMTKCAQAASASEGMEKPAALFHSVCDQLTQLRSCKQWDDIVRNMQIDFGRLTFSKKITDHELAEQMKAVRDACKKGIAKKLRRFSDNSKQILSDMKDSTASVRGLIELTRDFAKGYDKLKRARRIMDFSDLEHKALDLLIGKKRTGPTAIAYEIGSRFREVMVDEYQDSNGVQDAIFSAITNEKQNCFMVGDVKQSIYQFRLADPGIFLEKYNSYVHAENAHPGEGRKVLLSHNFRSGGSVIDAVNHVFSTCMSQQVGGLFYGEDEFLREGIPHNALGEPETELHVVRVQEDTYVEESAFVAERICQLLDGTHYVRDGDQFRTIRPEDIVILLRSPGSVGHAFVRALAERGIRCSMGTGNNLLQAEEVEILRAILQAIDNPLQDIPLVSTLCSRVFGFTANDLASIRGEHKTGCIYDALLASKTDKAVAFLNTLNLLREEAKMCSVPQLLHRIFTVTKLDSIFMAMENGDVRNENLQYFCQIASNFDVNGAKSLGSFLQHLEAMDEFGLVAPGEENATNAVTVMSIHKSKGLEFPVVFLCGLSREFNRDSTRAQVLCDKELGIGLSCIDSVNRVRYPSLAKRSIAAKMLDQSLSEEMRVLYVAMTRARDRLIMTYADRNLEGLFSDISLRMNFSDTLLLTADVDCPGKWVLLAALKRNDAGMLHNMYSSVSQMARMDSPWLIRVADAPMIRSEIASHPRSADRITEDTIERLRKALSFRYPYPLATISPSKRTATELKGRDKDREAAENAVDEPKQVRSWRLPSFVRPSANAKTYGNAVHAVMQYISYRACTDLESIDREIKRLVQEEYISKEYGEIVDSTAILKFFTSDLGIKIRSDENVLREFKFSILDDGADYSPGMENERVLLQGVVDCALIEADGITVVDFKTDRVTEDTLSAAVDRYRAQVNVYAEALSRIYQKPVKSKQLYFFQLGQFATV